eukprot:gene13540-15692_t
MQPLHIGARRLSGDEGLLGAHRDQREQGHRSDDGEEIESGGQSARRILDHPPDHRPGGGEGGDKAHPGHQLEVPRASERLQQHEGGGQRARAIARPDRDDGEA